jgi:hemoglobin
VVREHLAPNQREEKEKLVMPDAGHSLYARLGGYDAIAAVVDNLQERLENDPLLGRYWSARRSSETDRRVRQLTIDYIAAATGGPTFYLGHDMRIAHAGMGLTKEDYAAFTRHLMATLDKFKVIEPERSEVAAFIASLETQIVEK